MGGMTSQTSGRWAVGGGRRGGATPWGRLATGSLFFEGELLHFPHQRVKLANNISRAANKNNALTELNVSYFVYIFCNLYFKTFGIFWVLIETNLFLARFFI